MFSSHSDTDDGSSYCINGSDRIVREIKRIRLSFFEKVFNFQDEGRLTRYVRYHQRALVSLMDESAALRSGAGFSSQDYTSLEELLSFIEQHFGTYFDQDAKVPDTYIENAKREVRENLDTIESKLEEINPGAAINEILLHPLKKFIARESCTFRSAHYASEIQQSLVKVVTRADTISDVSCQLHLLLYYLNFNSKKCFTYLTDQIREVTNADTYREKVERLAFELKQVNQAQVKPGLSYDHQGASLKSQVNDYILEEISYLERSQKLVAGHPGTTPENTFPEFKIKVDLSVSQLAFLVRILIDSNVIQNKNTAELLRFVANFAVTKRSESISSGSFRSKFYDVEWSTKVSVKDVLVRMMGCIEGKR